MGIYVCSYCYFTYREEEGLPEMGIKPGTAFEDLPDDWCCPECGVSKSEFREYKEKPRELV
ncbi:rubredoxin [bacterium]|nr:rubredoxin [bacterium]